VVVGTHDPTQDTKEDGDGPGGGAGGGAVVLGGLGLAGVPGLGAWQTDRRVPRWR
jgi:hypothetical protein